MDTSLVEGYIFFFEVLDMVGKECQHPPRIFNTFYWFAAHYSLSAFFHRKKRYERSIAIPMSVV